MHHCKLSLPLLLAAASGVSAQQPVTVRDSIPGTLVTWEMVTVPGGRVAVPGPTGPMEVDVPTFLIGKTEVTWDMYDVFQLRLDLPREERNRVAASARPSDPYGAPDHGFGHRGFPAMSITYDGARKFAAWLSERTGHTYVVPTDAQWSRAAELAAAGLDAGGIDSIGWNAGNSSARTHAVAGKPADRLGLHDLFGNVGEWVLGADSLPLLRGGSYRDPSAEIGPERRARQAPFWNETDPQIPKSRWWLSDGPFVGFRLVRIP